MRTVLCFLTVTHKTLTFRTPKFWVKVYILGSVDVLSAQEIGFEELVEKPQVQVFHQIKG